MNKNMVYFGLVVVAVVLYLVFSGGNPYKKAVDHLELAYLKAYSGQQGYSVRCQYKEVDGRHWVLCTSTPAKNAGLWQVTGDDGQFEYLASNGKALTTMERFQGSEFRRNPDSSQISAALAAFN